MKHLGDITKIDGHKVPLVDIVTGGSPCQDLSVAGKRAGLDGERSGLFMEQIRIVKEMRDECRLQMRGADDNGRVIPRFMVWENVPGAFSSNKGEDFRCVLEEVCRVTDKDATVPMPEKGKWSTSGCIMGDGYSVAWRVHDAQFWGVPQRRKRIALVADFGGASAPEILFERKGLSRDITESGEQGKRVIATSERNFDKAISFQERAGCEGGAKGYSYNITESEPCQHSITKQSCNSSGDDISGTLDASYYKGCGERQGIEREVVYCLQGNGIDRADTAGCNGKGWREDESYTLNTIDKHAVCVGNGQMCNITMKPIANGLDCMHDQQAIITYGLDRASFNQGKNAQYDFQVQEEIAQTIVAKGPGGVLTHK
jgi:DNA (cytosine-5)-methyltransferase 1